MFYGKVERRKKFERREDVNLSNSVFGECWQNELKEIDKHEIVVKISEILGECPSNLHYAENIFEEMKFDIAKFVIHHVYSREEQIRSRLLLWLDKQTDTVNEEKLSDFIEEYMK